MHSFYHIWNKIIYSGVKSTEDPLTSRVVQTKKVAFLTLSLILSFAVVCASLKLFLFAQVACIFFTLQLLANIAFYKGDFTTGRIISILVMNVGILSFANIIGENAYFQCHLFTTLIASFTYFSVTEKKLLLFSVLCPPLVWVILELTNYNFIDIHYKIDPLTLTIIKVFNFFSTLIQTAWFSYQFLSNSFKNEAKMKINITALINKERELLQKNKDLKVKTEELLGIQNLLSANQHILKEEKNKAEQALKVKTDFLSNMSHEIRTPMNVIVGLTDLLIEIESNEDKRRNLELIKNSSNNLLVVINDILDFSRIESGKMILEDISFNLRDRINETVKSFEIRTKNNNNSLILRIDDNVPNTINSDPIRLNQVLINLLSNANKFTHNGKIEILVSAKNQMGSKTTLKFEIKDTGIGIPKSALNKIFESFVQASSSTTRIFGGTGLGLPICKRILELMGGKLWVTSKEKIGSSFFFEVPITVKPLDNVFIKNGNDSSLYCLINEDSEMNKMMLSKILNNLDIKPIFCCDIHEIKNHLKNRHFHFILIDLSQDDFSVSELKEAVTVSPRTKLLIFENSASKNCAIDNATYIHQPLRKKQLATIKKQITINE